MRTDSTNTTNTPTTSNDTPSLLELVAAFNRLAVAVEHLSLARNDPVSAAETGSTTEGPASSTIPTVSPAHVGHGSGPAGPGIVTITATAAVTAPTIVINSAPPIALKSEAPSAAPAVPTTPTPSPVPPADLATVPRETAITSASPPPLPLQIEIIHPDQLYTLTQTLTSPDGRWYLITCGRGVGVFPSWEEAGPLVIGCRNAIHRRYDDRDVAVNAYRVAWNLGRIVRRT